APVAAKAPAAPVKSAVKAHAPTPPPVPAPVLPKRTPGAKIIRAGTHPAAKPPVASEAAPATIAPEPAKVKRAEPAAKKAPAAKTPAHPAHAKAAVEAAPLPAPQEEAPKAPARKAAAPKAEAPKPEPSARPVRPAGGGPMIHHGPGVTPRPSQPQAARPVAAATRTAQPSAPPRPPQPQSQRYGQPAPSPSHRPSAPAAGGFPQRRPGGPPPRGPVGQRPGAPQHRDQRPGQAPAPRPGEPRPPQAITPRGPEPSKTPSRLAPVPEQRRKTKRERRHDKLQAKQNRRERLETELEQARANAETGEAVFIREGITVKELADKLSVKIRDVIAKLMSRGILATINQPLDKQVAVEICSQFGFAAEVISFEDEMVMTQEETPEENKVPRAPVVTIMGHVDHGKSSLLEAIHDVDITSKEFGGITQHIGAYKVKHGEREYVFLDTPGHEAFTLMRARGAQVTDIVILVVAADDGVMPQTIEAINHCKAANVPMVVAINKMDKPGADVDRVKRSLSEQGVLTEDWGGDVVAVPVSAKSRLGIEEMLEMVSIVADMLDLKANPEAMASGTVLESRMDRARGPVATVLMQDGHIKVGDLFLCGTTYGHVRNLHDDKGVRIDRAGPSTPVEVLGFPEVPGVGAMFQGMDDEAKARQVASFRKEQVKAKALRTTKVRLDNVFGAIQQGEIQELALILKADVHGSLEAITQSLNELSTEEIKINVVHQGVGAVSEGDILLASASNALVIGFNVRPERKAQDLAKAEGVEIYLFTVIYDLIDRMRQALTGMLKPIEEEAVLGHAEVKEIFKVSKVGTVAGCVVIDGKVVRSAKIRVLRDNVVVHTGQMTALKRFKDDASEVKDGTECGISLENYNDIKPGDVIESYEIRFQERTL
ncbi:MAG: translation initiation factor IF-2, partial [Acidobacteria bacterium 37-65-4]